MLEVTEREEVVVKVGLKPSGPIVPNLAPRPILQTLVQVDWVPGPPLYCSQLGPAPRDAGPGCTTQWAFKNPLWVGAGSEMRSQYLPDH